MTEVAVGKLSLHPEADRVPGMTPAAFAEFVADVKERGIRTPLELQPGTKTILDGRCRLLAAKEAGITSVPVIYAALNGDDPVIYMIRSASKRRHLTDDQRAMLAEEERKWLATKSKKERAQKGREVGGKATSNQQAARKDRSGATSASKRSEQPQPRAREQAAAAYHVSPHKVRQAQKVSAAAPDLAEKVKKDEMPLAQAVREIDRRQRRKDMEEKAAAASETVKALQAAGSLPWEIRVGDCLDVLASVPPGSARLAFADPPYNIGVDYGAGEKADRLPDAEFVAWCGQWIALVHKALAPDGSFWLLIGDEYADHLGVELRKAGFMRRSWVKWYETFGVACSNNFNRCSRHLFYCVKDPARFIFNREAVSRPSDRQIIYEDPRADPAGKLWDDVWKIPRLFGTATERLPDFPTQLPLALLRPIIGCSSDPGDLVLDPFSGSATAGVAAVEAGRRYLGIEKQSRFAELATLRMKGITQAAAS